MPTLSKEVRVARVMKIFKGKGPITIHDHDHEANETAVRDEDWDATGN